jgi:hypothetical protein
MKAGIYLRDPKKDDALLIKLREYGRAKGWKAGETYSGNIHTMLKDAKNMKFDVLLFSTLADISHDGIEATVLLLGQLSAFGVRWHSFSQPDLSTVADNTPANAVITALLAQNQSD